MAGRGTVGVLVSRWGRGSAAGPRGRRRRSAPLPGQRIPRPGSAPGEAVTVHAASSSPRVALRASIAAVASDRSEATRTKLPPALAAASRAGGASTRDVPEDLLQGGHLGAGEAERRGSRSCSARTSHRGAASSRTSSRNSRVVRCHGTDTPPKASPITRSALSSGTLVDVQPGVAGDDVDVRPRLEAQLVLGDGGPAAGRARAPWTGCPGGWPAGSAGRLKPAATDVDDVEGLAGGCDGGQHVLHRLGVGELEVGRVVEVDVAVPQRVQPQDPAAGAVGVGLDEGAEVRRTRTRTG